MAGATLCQSAPRNLPCDGRAGVQFHVERQKDLNAPPPVGTASGLKGRRRNEWPCALRSWSVKLLFTCDKLPVRGIMPGPTGADRAGNGGPPSLARGRAFSIQGGQPCDCASNQQPEQGHGNRQFRGYAASVAPLPFEASTAFLHEKLFPILHAECAVGRKSRGSKIRWRRRLGCRWKSL